MNTQTTILPDLNLFPHHRESIHRMLDHLSSEPGLIAVILGGSLVKGLARPDSDLDALVILTDDAYQKRVEQNAISDCIFKKCTYEKGYFDLKFFPASYLFIAAERGSEPTRNSFVKTRLLHSNNNRITDQLLVQIASYPEHEVTKKIQSFYSAFAFATGYFWWESKKRDLVYLRTRCAADAVLFGLRLILVHNRKLFPCQKWLFDAVENCPEKPANILELATAFLQEPNDATMQAFKTAISEFRDWGPNQKNPVACLSTVIKDQEQWWWNERPNLYEW